MAPALPVSGRRAMRAAPAILMTALTTAAAFADAPQGAVAICDTSGTEITRLEGNGTWCLSWAHSVTGGAVMDCFQMRDQQLFLTHSYLHDFAAGLGEVPGRGHIRAADDGGYWIEGINEPLPPEGLALRIGPDAVGHVLRSELGTRDLSALAANQRVRLRPAPCP